MGVMEYPATLGRTREVEAGGSELKVIFDYIVLGVTSMHCYM